MFQLHPSGHLFAPGHVAKLELLPKDAGGSALNSYGRPANGQGDITVSNLDLRLPVSDGPGAAAGQVSAAPALPLPCGMAIAPEFSSADYVRATLGAGKLKIKGKKAKVPVDSAPGSNPCQVQVKLLGAGKATASAAKKKRRRRRASTWARAARPSPAARAQTVKVKLTKRGRKALSRGKAVRVQVTTIDPTGDTAQTTKVKLGKKHKKHKKHGSKKHGK